MGFDPGARGAAGQKADKAYVDKALNSKADKSFAEYFSKTDPDFLTGKALSASDGSVVTASDYNTTGYIPIQADEWVQFIAKFQDGTSHDVLNGDATSAWSGYAGKVHIYDSNKTWLRSVNFVTNPYSTSQPVIGQKGFVRFQYINTAYYNFENHIYKQYGSPTVIDLFMIMGQSNIAGRGAIRTGYESLDVKMAVNSGAGWEFRAITDPTKLYTINEATTPFGYAENVTGKIDDGTSKSGSLVPAFINAYYSVTKVPVVAVSATKGGTTISTWATTGTLLPDAITRLNTAKTWLTNNGYSIRHTYMLWCQGENDAGASDNSQAYMDALKPIIQAMVNAGVEKCLLIRIGNWQSDPTKTQYIQAAHTTLCKNESNFVMVSTKFAEMSNQGLMKDEYHFYQQAYNVVGNEAGLNAGFYANNQKEPTMYDWKNGNLYYSLKI